MIEILIELKRCLESSVKRYSIDDAIKEAVKKGGKCLSVEFSSSKKMKWECGKCYRTWEALFYSIKKGSWCPHCCNPYEHRSMKPHICTTCGQSFFSTRKEAKFCSRLCKRKETKTRDKYNASLRAYNKRESKSPKVRYRKILSKSIEIGFKSDLTLEDLETLWSKGCTYCGESLLDSCGSGLDRLNPNNGYTKDNVTPCCGKCNQIRNVHLTHDEMIVAMQAVLNLRKTKTTI
jgi:bacterioferritin-associated ferredoxin